MHHRRRELRHSVCPRDGTVGATRPHGGAPRACMVENCACVLEHDSLNCLMMLETFSKRWTSV
eukprot:4993526-Prymnesium_polylepis.1